MVYDPWIEHSPIRLYNADQLAERVQAENADILIVESDSVKGPVLDLPLVADRLVPRRPEQRRHPGRNRRGIPVLRAPGRNADAVAEMTVALLFAVNRRVVAADRDVRPVRPGATAPSPTSGSGRGSSRARPPGSSGSARSAGPRSGASRASA